MWVQAARPHAPGTCCGRQPAFLKVTQSVFFWHRQNMGGQRGPPCSPVCSAGLFHAGLPGLDSLLKKSAFRTGRQLNQDVKSIFLSETKFKTHGSLLMMCDDRSAAEHPSSRVVLFIFVNWAVYIDLHIPSTNSLVYMSKQSSVFSSAMETALTQRAQFNAVGCLQSWGCWVITDCLSCHTPVRT